MCVANDDESETSKITKHNIAGMNIIKKKLAQL